MNPQTKATILILLLLVIGTTGRVRDLDLANPTRDKVVAKMGIRRLIEVDTMYDDYMKPGANPKHQPKQGN